MPGADPMTLVPGPNRGLSAVLSDFGGIYFANAYPI
jgi:hypothetical protein